MHKRKLHANIDHILNAKKRAEEGKLDILFNNASCSGTTGKELSPKPCNVSEGLVYIRSLVEWRKFCGEFLKHCT